VSGFNRAVWDGDAPLVAPTPGARTIGDLALLELGCSAWSAQRKNHRGDPLGGVIVDIFDKRNEDTGFAERAFRCLDPYNFEPKLKVPMVHVLLESEIDREAVEGPESSRLRKIIRALAYGISQGRSSLTTTDLEHIAWMHKLAGVVVPK
jgi:hypothetical protein